jgi:hypothetical protein
MRLSILFSFTHELKSRSFLILLHRHAYSQICPCPS